MSIIEGDTVFNEPSVVGFDTHLVYYNQGTITFTIGTPLCDLVVILINDPNEEVLDTCTPLE